jgi:transposase
MECFVGIDVSKATLDIASLPDAETWVVTNDDAGLAELLPRLAALHPTLVVLEATGGFESAAVAALAKLGLPVVVVNPRQVRDFAKSIGRLAVEFAECPNCCPGIEPASASAGHAASFGWGEHMEGFGGIDWS